MTTHHNADRYADAFETVHVHTADATAYGVPHNPADDAPRHHLTAVLPHYVDGEPTGLYTVRRRAYPADLHAVIPNTGADIDNPTAPRWSPTIVIATATADTAVVDEVTGRDIAVRAGERVAFLPFPTATLAAWKAARTTTYGGGYHRHNRTGGEGAMPHTLPATNPEQSNAARKAHAFRAATIDGEPAVGKGRAYPTGEDAAAALSAVLPYLTGTA